MRGLILTIVAVALAGCSSAPDVTVPTNDAGKSRALGSDATAKGFAQVVSAVQPVAVDECRRRTKGANCDFRILVDANRRAPANAFQTIDENGRPVLTFTVALIEAVKNADELAFVMGHEASHHIAGHLERQEQNAESAAKVFSDLATLTGGDDADVKSAEELGAAVGARTYSKEFELEADALGTVITYRAGYNPLIGAQFFTRIPDPGDRFLSTHPPNAARLETVQRVSAQLGVR